MHAGVEPDSAKGAIMTLIYQTSTYVQAAAGNPTKNVLENAEDLKAALA